MGLSLANHGCACPSMSMSQNSPNRQNSDFDEKIEQIVEGQVTQQQSATSSRSQLSRINLRSATMEYNNDMPLGLLEKAEEGPYAAGDDLKWLHWLLGQHWPYLKKSMEKVIKKELEPIIQEALPKPLNKISFQDIDFGDVMPNFSDIHPVFDIQNDFKGVSLEMGVTWHCAGKIVMVLDPVRIGLENISLEGTVLLKLRPILDRLPIIGGMQITMLSPPQVQWNFTGGFALGLQMDVVTRTLRKVVADILSDMLVVPNQIFVHWLEGHAIGIDMDILEFPEPEIVMRLCVCGVEGLNLDSNANGCGWGCWTDHLSSYVMLQLGARNCQTPAIRSSESEGWFDLLVYTGDQHVNVEVFSQDITYQDVRLGTVEGLTVQNLVQQPEWKWPLSQRTDTESAHKAMKVELSAKFFHLSPTSEFVPTGKGNADTQAFLFVHLRSCRGIKEDSCEGARIRFKVGDEEVLGKSSSYHPMVDDTAIATPTQKMVEHLWETSDLPEKEMMKLMVEMTGLSPEEVSSIVYSRPTFTMRWGQFVAIGVKDVDRMSVQISLELRKIPGVGYAKLEEPITADRLMEAEDWVLDQPIALKPDLMASGNRIFHSDEIELNARFKLRCVSMHKR